MSGERAWKRPRSETGEVPSSANEMMANAPPDMTEPAPAGATSRGLRNVSYLSPSSVVKKKQRLTTWLQRGNFLPAVCRSRWPAIPGGQRNGQKLKGLSSSAQTGFADRQNAGRRPVDPTENVRQMGVSVMLGYAVYGVKNEAVRGHLRKSHGKRAKLLFLWYTCGFAPIGLDRQAVNP